MSAVINDVPGSLGAIERMRPGLWGAILPFLPDWSAPEAEAAYVVDLEHKTSVFLGVDIGRQYEERLGRPLGTYEMGVSLDLLGRTEESPWVRDLKFGQYHSWWQLYVQAMAVLWDKSRCVDDHSVDAGFLFLEENDDRWFAREEQATLYAMDLEERADELVGALKVAAQLAEGLPDQLNHMPVVEGKWCQYCPAFNSCPAKWKLAKSMLGMDVEHSVAALTPAQCGSAWLKLSEIKRNIIEKMEKALKHRMREEGGFVLESGKVLRLIEQRGRLGFDRDRAIELLRERGVSQAEIDGLMKRGDAYDSVRAVSADYKDK